MTEPAVSPAKSLLYQALAKAQGAVQNVAHDRQNQFHKYKYTSSEALIQEAKRVLAGTGLSAVMVGWELKLGEPALVDCEFCLVHESGDSLTGRAAFPAIPERGRPLDKAIAGALTTAWGYWLRGLLLIPRVGEGEDIAGRDDTGTDDKGRPKNKGNEGRTPATGTGSPEASGSAPASQGVPAEPPTPARLRSGRKPAEDAGTTAQHLADVAMKLREAAEASNWTGEEVARYCKDTFKTSYHNLTPPQLQKILDHLRDNPKPAQTEEKESVAS